MGKAKWKSRHGRQPKGDGDPRGSVDLRNDPSLVAEVESLFKKCFTYADPPEDGGNWALPPVEKWYSSPVWDDTQLANLKTTLNDMKASLNDMDINHWHEHTQATNRAGAVIQQVRRTKKPELCTQAWCKFHEVVATFPILSPWSGAREGHRPLTVCNADESGSPLPPSGFRSVHICEAPGAFIASLNHYLRTREYTGQWEWLANTLNPYYEGNSLSEMIADDRLIFDTLDRWYFGPDNSGDIIDQATIKGLKSKADQQGTVNLVTCDGSIDCQNHPEDQEVLVGPLHHAELTAGLLLLAAGGSLVLKMFTMFEHFSVCMMYLLNCVFTQVNVFKPATSKAGNSEVYLVCLGYRGCNDQVRELLLKHVDKTLPCSAMFPKDAIPERFLEEHRKGVELLTRWQMQTIQENITLFRHASAEVLARLAAARSRCTSHFIDKFNIRPLAAEHHLVAKFQTKGHGLHGAPARAPAIAHRPLSRRCHSGSFLERRSELQLPWVERLRQMSLYEENSDCWNWLQGFCTLENEDLHTWQLTFGRTPGKIQSSHFCDLTILQFFNELIEHQEEETNYEINWTQIGKDLESLSATFVGDIEDQTKVKLIQLGQNGGPLVASLGNSSHFELTESVSDFDAESRNLFALEPQPWDTSLKLPDFLIPLAQMFKVIKSGDHCMLLLPKLYTRIAAGLLYLVYASFQQICVRQVDKEAVAPLLVIGCNYKGRDKNPVITWLERLRTEIDMRKQDSRDVVEFVPIHVLFESTFYQFLCHSNDLVLKCQSNAMIKRQRVPVAQDGSSLSHVIQS